jgi:hypothetical protein
MVKTIGRWSTRKSADEEKEKATIKEIRQMESTVEAGQSMIGNGSRVSFYKVLDSSKSPFLFLVVLVFRYK